MTNMSDIYSKYYKQIYGFTYKMVNNREDAEDLTQEIFMKISSKIETYDESRKFINWILRIAQNTCTDFHRKKQREFKIFDTETNFDSAIPTYHETHSDPEIYGKFRIVDSLRSVCELQSKEIALICGIPIPTVVWIARRAKTDMELSDD